MIKSSIASYKPKNNALCFKNVSALLSVNAVNCAMEGFVLGGSVTQIRNYPHSVYLNILCNASFICGGSVLNQLVVLTAGHCLEECRRPSSDDVFIKYGHENLDKMWSTRMKGFVIHEYYHDGLMENDIALVTSVRALPLGRVVQRVVLVQQTPNIKLGFMAGWGAMNAKKDVSRTLLDVVQELQPPKVCRLVGPMPRGAFCAGPITGTEAPDLGDSGSALMVKRFIQIGLVSYKVERYSLVVYTNVSYHYNWIRRSSSRLICKNYREVRRYEN